MITTVLRIKIPGPNAKGTRLTPFETDQFILSQLSPGFEVCWSTRNEWPVDPEGYTWILVRCTDQKQAVGYWIEQSLTMAKRRAELRELAEQLNRLSHLC